MQPPDNVRCSTCAHYDTGSGECRKYLWLQRDTQTPSVAELRGSYAYDDFWCSCWKSSDPSDPSNQSDSQEPANG